MMTLFNFILSGLAFVLGLLLEVTALGLMVIIYTLSTAEASYSKNTFPIVLSEELNCTFTILQIQIALSILIVICDVASSRLLHKKVLYIQSLIYEMIAVSVIIWELANLFFLSDCDYDILVLGIMTVVASRMLDPDRSA